MWTPRRIGFLVLGFVLLLAAYITYAFTPFGRIDSLPALPPELLLKAEESGSPDGPRNTSNVNDMDHQLEVAFGKECLERDYAIKFQVRSKGMVLAAKEFVILKDGRVQLAPVSCAIFGKNNGDGKFPEINTIRANVAFLTFDRPIVHPADMGKHKIVFGEVKGNVDVVNNRRTPERDDDLTLFTQGPLFFKDDEHHIWTNVEVEIKDLQSKPDPTRVNAVGMDVWLATEATTSANTPPASPKLGPPVAGGPNAPKKNAPKKRPESITGVDRVALRQDVVMHLFVDSDSGFLGNPQNEAGKKERGKKEKGKDKKAATPPNVGKVVAEGLQLNTKGDLQADAIEIHGPFPSPPQPKSHVVIQTQGPFNYDVARSHAQFDISERPGPYPNRVSVNRFREEGKIDELDCERLEIQFSPKDAEGPNAPAKTVKDDRSLELEMETAHATGKDVMLKSDAEVLEAYGNDFFYDRRTQESILKGDPEMFALQKGNEIHARELRMINQKDSQQATALGPGQIDLLDEKTGKRPLHARWKETLVYAKDGVYDLLVLTGDAAFLDDDHQQQLQADTLKVWLEPPDKEVKKESPPPDPAEKPAGQAPAAAQGRKPHHVEAIGHVEAHSPDMNVHDNERLVIWFKDAAVGMEDLPALRPDAKKEDKPAAGTEPTTAAPAPADAAAAPPVPTPAGAPTPVPTPAAATTSTDTPTDKEPPLAKQPRPLDLTARMVEAHVLRIGPRNELERLWTEGNVHVHQDPEKPDEKGVDIVGETLQLTRRSQGNVLVVTDHHDLAKLRMDKIYIVGPVVHIDQTENKAWVNGAGLMIMDNNSTFQGGKLNKTVPLEIHWNKTMYFDGQWAEFHGGVQAEQENSTLLCQSMQVFLDRAVSLKGEDKGAPPAKVRKLACDQKVEVEDKEFDPNNKLVKYQRLECPELSVDNEEGVVLAAGPGIVRILQRGSEEPQLTPGPEQRNKTARPAPAGGKKAADDELKLTRIRYQGRMYANNKNHTAIFTDNVEVFNVPSENPNMELEREKLPEGGLWLRSDKLEVYSRPQEDGKSNQEMRASGHVSFRTQDSMGSSAVITYHSEKEQVILEGGEGGIATLYQEKVKGGPRKTMKAEKIIYLRSTGEFTGIRIKEVTGN
jgi:lipopolysaccharide export system protein LptA